MSAGFVMFCLALPLGILAFRFFLTSIPKSSVSDKSDFASSLPDGFGYPYYLDGSGYGISVPEGKIFIQSNGKTKIYDHSKIREIEWKIEGANKTTLHGTVSIAQRANTALQNRKFKKQAYEASGIFISTADIENPVWQIKYSNESELRRSAEILQQFLNRELMDYQEYVRLGG